ncbi:MAG: methionine synthase [Chitinivibrionales bacterium]|nr:methionine synthase [Chitinivibrionales bacterium]MBD3394701.1 methionine synthase [Chitinivibrionales bacterium]
MGVIDKVASGKVLVSDGAWGTFLQKKGLAVGACPEAWCLDCPDDVLAIAASYIDAGADMIQTNSFGASRFKLEHFGLAHRAQEINEAAAAISRRAAGPDRHVIASVGPTGKMLLMGDVTAEQLYDAFREQVVALENGGAEAICVETMSAIDEACLAVRAARENTNCEVLCTFTFEKTANNDYRTMMGVSPAEMAPAVIDAGAHIIGANCGNGMERMIDIVKELRSVHGSIPVLVHANAGLPVLKDGENVFPETPADMAARTPALVNAGTNIVGGCCGTTPAHIAAIRAAVDAISG